MVPQSAPSEAGAVPAGFVRAACLDDFTERGLLGVDIDGDRVCLVRLGDDVFALEDRCTHALFPLSRGELMPDGVLQCAWHGAQFDCRTGSPCRGPATVDAQTYD